MSEKAEKLKRILIVSDRIGGVLVLFTLIILPIILWRQYLQSEPVQTSGRVRKVVIACREFASESELKKFPESLDRLLEGAYIDDPIDLTYRNYEGVQVRFNYTGADRNFVADGPPQIMVFTDSDLKMRRIVGYTDGSVRRVSDSSGFLNQLANEEDGGVE